MFVEMLEKYWRPSIATMCVVGFLTMFFLVLVETIKASESDVACDPVTVGVLHRYIEGIDECVTPLDESEAAELTDPFAVAVLRNGIFPDTLDTLDLAIVEALGYKATVYLVGEGSQVPPTVASREENRFLRYATTWGENENEAKIMSSKLAPRDVSSFIEVISFDERTGEYNYYFFLPQVTDWEPPYVWAWVGSTSMALEPDTINQGCFRCHHNGLPVMRELESPWANWHSQRAVILSALVPTAMMNERSFIPRDGAEIMENVIRGSIHNYYQAWLAERMSQDGEVTHLVDVDKMLRHLATNTTVNFKSSEIQSKRENAAIPDEGIKGVPPRDTFLADSLFQTVLGLDYDSLSVTLPRKDYDAFIEKYNFRIVATSEFVGGDVVYEEPGSTYFAFYVPQLATEDILMAQFLLQANIVTEKFVAAMLMVDYQNPLFSEKRAGLQKYFKAVDTGMIINGQSSVPARIVAEIEATGAEACSADNFDDCSAEEQFLYIWNLPDDSWKETVAAHLQSHVDSIKNMPEATRLDYLMRWSINQRDRLTATPRLCNFVEVSAIFPQNDLAQSPECPQEVESTGVYASASEEEAFMFDTPAYVNDFPDDEETAQRLRKTWHDHLNRFTERSLQNDPWNFVNQGPYMAYFNPVNTIIPEDAPVVLLSWTTYPNRVRFYYPEASRSEHWAYADDGPPPSPNEDYYSVPNHRDWQDEYAEWNVIRNEEGKITKVQFTSETREYFYALWDMSPETVLDIYRQLASEEVELEDLYLRDEEGNPIIDPQTGRPAYDEYNRWNGQEGSPAIHMIAAFNFYGGALFLTAQSTIQREDSEGNRINDINQILNCSWQGTIARNSDPSISAFVNDLVGGAGVQVTLANPVGVYIQEPNFDIYQLPPNAPEGAHASDYWTVLRGHPRQDGEAYDQILHAVYEVPEEHGFTVGDITINGFPIEYGAQLADTVNVVAVGVGIPLDEPAETHPCVDYGNLPYPAALREKPLLTVAERSALARKIEQGSVIENIALKATNSTAETTIEFVGAPGVTVTKTGFEEDGDAQIFFLTITAAEDAPLGDRSILLTNSDGLAGPARYGMLEVVESGSLGYAE